MRVIQRRFDVRLISSEALSQYLKYRGMSLRQVAERAGCSKSTIGHLTTGHVRQTRPETARAICKALDVPVEVLFVPRVSTVQRDVPWARRRA